MKKWQITFLLALILILSISLISKVNAQHSDNEYDQIIEKCTYEITANPNRAGLYLERGCAYEDIKEYNLAVKDYNKALQLDNTKDRVYNMYVWRRVMGYIMWAPDSLDNLINRYSQKIDFENQDISAYKNRGALYITKGKNDLAILDFNKALQIEPYDIFIYELRAMAYMSEKNCNLAIKDYTKALEINPQYYPIYRARAAAYMAMKKHDLALSDYNQYIAFFNPIDANIYKERGLLYQEIGNFDLSITDYSKAIELDPNNYENYIKRANAYHYKKLNNLAVNDYNRAIELSPIAKNYILRGKFFEDNNEYDLAIEDYSAVLRLNPKDTLGLFFRGELYRKIGNYDLAIADFNKVLEINPGIKAAYEKRDMCYYEKSLIK